MPLSAIHSSTRVSASSSSRKRRRTGSRSAKSITCEAVSRSSASSSSRATTPSTGFVWRSERSASRTRRSGSPASSGSPSTDDVPRAERGLDERREDLDVRAHHDHVARLQRRVLLHRVQDRVAQDLDLARAAVAGVDLDAAVLGVQRRPGVGVAGVRRARRGACPRARRPGGGPAGSRRRASTGCSVELMSGPSTSWSSRASCPHEPSSRFSGVSTVGSSARRVTRGVPSSRRHSAGDGCSRKSRTSRWSGQRLQDTQLAGREPREAEQREALRQVREGRLGAQARARGRHAGGRVGHVQPRVQAPPQLAAASARPRRPPRPG